MISNPFLSQYHFCYLHILNRLIFNLFHRVRSNIIFAPRLWFNDLLCEGFYVSISTFVHLNDPFVLKGIITFFINELRDLKFSIMYSDGEYIKFIKFKYNNDRVSSKKET